MTARSAAFLLFLAGLLTVPPAVPLVRAQHVRAHLSADSVTVGERFYLSIVAEHNALNEPFFPAVSDTLFGDLEVIEQHDRTERYLGSDEPGTRVDSIVYEVTTFALDTAFVPPIPITFSADADADTMIVTTLPLEVPVRSLVPPEAEEPHDLAPLVAFPRPLWHWVALGLGLLAVLALVIYLLRRRQQPAAPTPAAAAPPLPSPYEEARQRLLTLEQADLASPEAIKPFYVELSNLLRTYLERRLHVPALETTTYELIGTLRQSATDVVRPEVRARVRTLLSSADLVKFAEHRPPAADGREALAETRAILDEVETAAPPEPVEEEVEAAPPPDAATAPKDDVPPLLPRDLHPLAWLGGFLLALALTLYAGFENVALPVLGGLLAYVLARRFAAPHRQPVVPAFAVQTGQFLWMSVGYLLTAPPDGAFWLGIEVLLLGSGLAWLLLQPGKSPLLLLGILQGIGLLVNLLGFFDAPLGGMQSHALSLHLTLRTLALLLMVAAWRRLDAGLPRPAEPIT